MIPFVTLHSIHDIAEQLGRNDGPQWLSRDLEVYVRQRAQLVRAGQFDFDGSLIKGSQWRGIGELLTPAHRAVDMDNFHWYHGHNHDSTHSNTSMEDPDWWVRHLDEGNKAAAEAAWAVDMVRMLALDDVTSKDIECVGAQLTPRDGALELLRLLSPRCIISFGIEQVIKAWLEHHNIPTPVAATRLIYDDLGVVDRCHLNVVGSASKRYASERFRSITGVSDEGLLSLGDTVVDVHMMHDGGFNILLLPPGEVDKKLAAYRTDNLPAMWHRLTAILMSDSLQPLVELLRDTP